MYLFSYLTVNEPEFCWPVREHYFNGYYRILIIALSGTMKRLWFSHLHFRKSSLNVAFIVNVDCLVYRTLYTCEIDKKWASLWDDICYENCLSLWNYLISKENMFLGVGSLVIKLSKEIIQPSSNCDVCVFIDSKWLTTV